MVVVGFPSKVPQSWQMYIRSSSGASWSATSRHFVAPTVLAPVVFPQPIPDRNAEMLMLLREIRDQGVESAAGSSIANRGTWRSDIEFGLRI
jgi:hypothetical protein